MRSRLPLFALRLSCLTVLALVLGCGGGGGGGSSSGGNPVIFTRTETVGAAGGSVATDDGTVTLVVPPGTVSSDTSITLEQRQKPVAGITPASASGLAHAVTVSIDPSQMMDGSAVEVEVPQLKPYDELRTIVFAFSKTSLVIPLDTRLAPSTGKVFASLPKETLQALLDHGRATPSRGLDIRTNIAVSAIGALGATVPAEGQLYYYKPKDSNTRGDWEKADGYAMPSGRIAVLLHGISNDIDDMKDVARFVAGLKDKGGNLVYREVWGYGYRWWAPIDANGALFASKLRAARNADAQIDLYGHSMGGLVSRWALEKEGLGADIHKLVTLGTPHHGVPMQVLQYLINYGAAQLGVDASTLAAGVEDLVEPKSDPFQRAFINRLNSDDTPSYRATADYYTLAGIHYEDYLSPVGSWSFAWYNTITTTLEDGIVPQESALFSGLAQKSDSWASDPSTHIAVSNINHAQLNGGDDYEQSRMVLAVKPFILASLAGTVK